MSNLKHRNNDVLATKREKAIKDVSSPIFSICKILSNNRDVL